MIVIGCLSLVVLPLGGFTAGVLLAGARGGTWGAVFGLAAALAIVGVGGYALARAGRRD